MAAWGGWRAFGAWLDCSVFPGGGPLCFTTKLGARVAKRGRPNARAPLCCKIGRRHSSLAKGRRQLVG